MEWLQSFIVALSFASCGLSKLLTVEAVREFRIDYDNDQFLLDGEPFRYVSGEFHYFRSPPEYWQDRLRKIRGTGMNAVTTYVEWSLHEPSPGVFNFEGQADLVRFIQIAEKEGLKVLLRPGPYICAERDFGGFPPWLLTLNPKMALRTIDESYTKRVNIWFDVLFEKMIPLLYGNGGPIIMVQVENEYGSYFACDKKYTVWLRDLMKGYVKNAAVLYTTDGNGESYLNCGKIADVYATVDFGTSSNPSLSFGIQKKFEPKGPNVNSEFYPGWLTHWGEKLMRVDTAAVVKSLKQMLNLHASISVYMMHGGTNFGFTAGANYFKDYSSDITSYDYDAPISEAGDPTDKYYAMREVIGQYLPLPNMTVPSPSPKGKYGVISLKRIASVLDNDVRTSLGLAPVSQQNPISFEALGQSYGFVLYETQVDNITGDPAVLKAPGVRDRANVLVDGVSCGVISRVNQATELTLRIYPGQTLQIFVENQGRINFGSNINDTKGLISDVTLNDQVLENWMITGFPLHNVSWIEENHNKPLEGNLFPAFYYGEFTIDNALDTFLQPQGWDKGVAFINGINLGRYWPKIGPQVTLYVPGVYLKESPEVNKLVIFELESAPSDLKMSFVDTPQLDLKSCNCNQ